MIIFKETAPLTAHLEKLRSAGKTVGFVPTMGALHDGHLSLIRKSKAETEVTVCSIFVNPTQFNDPKDFEKYPVTTEKDIELLRKENTDVLFLPVIGEIYSDNIIADQHYDLGYLETILEGEHRPGHFQGVCQVVHRLLHIVQPRILFLGQKDFQQCMVLKKLVQLVSSPVIIRLGETIREQSGLAMSSRNMRLTNEQKQQATAIYRSLISIKENYPGKTPYTLKQQAISNLLNAGFEKVDYVEIAKADSLEPIGDNEILSASTPAVGLIAAFIGGVRLIDNMILT